MKHTAKDNSEFESVRASFTQAYEGTTPWELGRPQKPFVEIADEVKSPLLDSGCGTGNASLFFAERGHQVTGIDFVEEAIRQAREKAKARGLSVEFLVKDAMTLGEWDRRFATAIDSGLFHIYSSDARRTYVENLWHVLEPGGKLYLLSFNSEGPRGHDGVTRQQLCDAFANGWVVEQLKEVWGEINPKFLAESPADFPEGGILMWFAVVRARRYDRSMMRRRYCGGRAGIEVIEQVAHTETNNSRRAFIGSSSTATPAPRQLYSTKRNLEEKGDTQTSMSLFVHRLRCSL